MEQSSAMLVDTITPGPKKNLSSSRIKPPLSLGPTLQKGERRVGKGSRLDTVPDGKGKVKAQSDWSLRPIPVELGQIPVDTPKEIREVLKRAVAHCKAMRAPDAGKDHDNNPFRRANAITPTKVYDQSNSSGSTVNDSSTFGSSPTTSTTRTSIESNQQAIANETSHNTVSGTSASSDGSRSKPLDKQSSSRTPTITDSSSPFPIRKKRSTIFGRLWSTQTRAGDSRTNLAPGPSELLGKTSKTQECASCFEDVPRSTAMSLVCRHSYCRECLNRLVETAFQNENLWPPRCCLLDIPRPVIRKCLQAKNIAMFTWKEKEFSVPIQDRWYCTSSKCGRWFDPKVKRSSAKVECPHCRFKMCSHCRAEVHPVTISCPEDRGLRATIDTARREGYQRCYNCHTMVELKEGCQHITCSCKAHFCYTCGAKWKTCICTPDDQARRATELRAARTAADKEEAELLEAIRASEQTAREAREKRQREEEAEARRMEEERLRKIKVQYRESMSLLQKLYWFHLKQLVIRQDRELKQAQEAVARSETQKASEKRSLDQLMGVEAARRVVELKELSLRHCNNLCSQIEELEKLVKAGSINMVDQIKRFEELHTLQQEEHNRLRMQHDKNMGDFKESRADREIDEDLKVKKAQIQDLGQSRQADVLWLDLVHEVARGFLEEEEAHLIASGASLPGMGTPVRKYVSKS